MALALHSAAPGLRLRGQAASRARALPAAAPRPRCAAARRATTMRLSSGVVVQRAAGGRATRAHDVEAGAGGVAGSVTEDAGALIPRRRAAPTRHLHAAHLRASHILQLSCARGAGAPPARAAGLGRPARCALPASRALRAGAEDTSLARVLPYVLVAAIGAFLFGAPRGASGNTASAAFPLPR